MNISSSYRMYLDIEDVDTNPDDFVFQYELLEQRTSYSIVTLGTGTITLKNPTSSTNQKLVFDGIINKTLKRQ